MSMNTQIDLSKICGRKISDEEAARIREVASNLELRDDDAIWQLLAAIEYQKTYYETVPEKIEAVTVDIVKEIKVAAEKETQNAQAILTKSVVEQARNLATKIQWGKILPISIIALLLAMIYGALAMWCGYQLGAKSLIPLVEFLLMPFGLILGIIFHIAPFLYIAIILEIGKDTGKELLLHVIISICMFSIGIFLFYITGVAQKN